MEKFKVAFQGIKGAYSQEAITEFGKEKNIDFEAVPKKNFRELFEAINSETFLGMVPIENSNAGSVVQCYDLFWEYDFEIIGEYYLSVNHCLLAKKNCELEDIKEILSHPQALMQCSNFIEKNHLLAIEYGDTASSAKFVSESDRKDLASIASVISAEHYNLKILKKYFQNSSDNTTRFFLVKKKGKEFEFENKFENKKKSTLLFQTKNRAGALYKCLGAFATHNINLTKIESRPSKDKKFSYVFFVDVDNNLEGINAKQMIEELEFFSHNLKVLGKY